MAKSGPPPVREEVSNTSGTASKPLTGMFQRIPKPKITPKLVVAAVEGWGKTTMATQVPDVGLVAASTERGYETLLSADRVNNVPYVATSTWKETLKAIDELRGSPLKAVALDELSGFERQCFEHVKATVAEFKDDWARFWNYHKGAKLAAETEWLQFLLALQELDMPVILLSHCQIEKFDEPTSEGYNRYTSALHKYVWAATRRWADACLFGTFLTVVKDGKGIGGSDRILYTQHRDTHDAKNRFGMPEIVTMPPQRELAWGHVWNLIKEGGK